MAETSPHLPELTPDQIDRARLREAIVDLFNENELRTLTFDLGFDYENLAPGGKADKARELVGACYRNGRLLDLLHLCRKERPHIAWDNFTKTTRDADAPFKGLRYFDESDAALFYGRERVTADLVRHLGRHSFLTVVGASGSGKSSLVNLLPRFYDCDSGRILLDDIPLHELKLADLRAQIAYVGQQVLLFNDTIAANICYGSAREVSRDDLLKAAQNAYALEFIQALPDGFETLIGENGTRLSGGQRQRIAIARALLKNAPVLILDEATSALDTQSERQVQAALDRLRQGRTALVVAHRLSTIENADRIVVLQQGRIVETGCHAELLAANGVYASLYRLQDQPAGHA